jgi:hypothetical protein
METFNWIIDNLEGIWAVVASIVTVASLIAALTPSPKDDGIVNTTSSWLTKVRAVVNVLALNVKNAKNDKK